MSLAQKEVDELIKAIRGTGYKVVSAGRTHHRVLNPKGQVVVDENGPLIISKTPSESRWYEMTMHRLIKAGIFKVDPKKAGQQKKEGGGGKAELSEEQEELKRKRMEGMARASRNRDERTRKLRARLEPMIVKLGGSWSKRGFSAEFAQVAYHLLASRGVVDRWASLAGCIQNLNNLNRGATMSDKLASAWEAVLDDLEKAPDPKARYFELLRESKGITAKPPLVVPPRKPPIEPAAPSEVVERQQVVPLRPRAVAGPDAAIIPRLALQAVFLMTVGREEPVMDEILAVGEKIARLELEDELATAGGGDQQAHG